MTDEEATTVGELTSRGVVHAATYSQLAAMLGMIHQGFTLEQIEKSTTELIKEIAPGVPILIRRGIEKVTGEYFG